MHCCGVVKYERIGLDVPSAAWKQKILWPLVWRGHSCPRGLTFDLIVSGCSPVATSATEPVLSVVEGAGLTPGYAEASAVATTAPGFSRSYSHSLFGHAITGPAFKNFSTKYAFPQEGHFSGLGLCAEVNLHFG